MQNEVDKYAAIILSAGKGTRMNEGLSSPIPKVMFKLNDKPIVDYTVDIVRNAGINKIVLVVGYKKELIEKHCGDKVEYAVQDEQKGTGHAVMVAEDLVKGKAESDIVFYGDCPLYKSETVRKLIDLYEREKPTIAMLSAISADAGVYGRIFRSENGDVEAIIEAKDCTEEQLKNGEWNPGFYIFDSAWLWDNIHKLSNDNAQGEYYLTDLVALARSQGKRIVAIPVSEEDEAIGINTQEQLREAEEILKKRG